MLGVVKVWPPLMAPPNGPHYGPSVAPPNGPHNGPQNGPPRKTRVVGRTDSSFRKQSENVNACNWVICRYNFVFALLGDKVGRCR